jgi:hypothetical protein
LTRQAFLAIVWRVLPATSPRLSEGEGRKAPRCRTLACLLAGLAAPVLAASPDAAVEGPWTLAPPASWVEEIALPASPGSTPDAPEGIAYLLSDRQVRVAASGVDDYHRVIWTAVSTAGVQGASEVAISFDPAYQQLVIHDVRLLRDGREMRRLAAGDVRLIHAERELSARIYQGRLTALVFLEDLRVGDTVDYAYTLEGQNPILGGRFSSELALSFGTPVHRMRYRILMPKGRPLRIKAQHTRLVPRIVELPQETSYLWEASDVPERAWEEGQPRWYDISPRVSVGEFGTWGVVADLLTALFEHQLHGGAEVERLATELRSTNPRPEARLRAATRFVQDEVRYLGIEMGPSSHEPHPPEQTLAQRYGDCKDKALLLVALLRRLGIDAAPALVNTRAGRSLDQAQPSPFAFNHAIVEVRLQKHTVWIDATASQQGGAPLTWPPPPFERALVLRRGTRGLVSIPPLVLDRPETIVDESYELRRDGSARLAVKTRYRGREADEMRGSLATEARADVAKRYLDYYSHSDSDIRSAGDLRFDDDREDNVVTVTEGYDLPTFWKDGIRDVWAWSVSDELRRPSTLQRKTPFALTHPVYVEHTISVRPAPAFDRQGCGGSAGGPLFAYESTCRVIGDRLLLTRRYRSLRDHVEPSEIDDYVAALDAADGVVRLRRRSAGIRTGPSPSSSDEAWVGLALTSMVLAAFAWAGVGRLRRWRRRSAFRRSARLVEGLSPATALRAASLSVLERAIARRRCRCGARASFSIVERAQAQYDDRPMEILTVRCGACSEELDIYALVAPKDGSTAES